MEGKVWMFLFLTLWMLTHVIFSPIQILDQFTLINPALKSNLSTALKIESLHIEDLSSIVLHFCCCWEMVERCTWCWFHTPCTIVNTRYQLG